MSLFISFKKIKTIKNITSLLLKNLYQVEDAHFYSIFYLVNKLIEHNYLILQSYLIVKAPNHLKHLVRQKLDSLEKN